MDLLKFKVSVGGHVWINPDAVVYVGEGESAGLTIIGLNSGDSFQVEGTLDAIKEKVAPDRLVV